MKPRHLLPLLLLLLLCATSCVSKKSRFLPKNVHRKSQPPPPVTFFKSSRAMIMRTTTTTTTPRTTTASATDGNDGDLRGCRCSDGSQQCFCVNTHSCETVDYLPSSGVVWREGRCEENERCCRMEVDQDDDGGGRCGRQFAEDGHAPVAKKGQAEFGEAPWMALLLISERHGGERQWTPLCGGSLVTMTVVLTAAHCIVGVDIEEMEVRAGEWDYQVAVEDLQPQVSRVSAIAVHEHYKDGTLINDVALVFLRRKFLRRDNVTPVCLPMAEVKVDEEDCFATGWGRNRYGVLGNVTTTMHKADHLRILDGKDCEDKLRRTRLGQEFSLNPSFLCALGSGDHQDVCQGDGGGPLVCPLKGTPGSKIYVQMGVVSWGIDCGLEDVPGVYVNLKEYSHWIKGHLVAADRAMPTFYGGS